MYQLPTSRHRELVNDETKLEISPVLVTMQHIFEKYEAETYW